MRLPRISLLAASLLSLAISAATASADVTVSSPASNSAVSSPTAYSATSTTNCSLGVASMGVYVDNHLTFVSQGSTLNTSITLPTGTHNTVVQEWDYCGGSTYTPVNNLTVGAPAATNNPPGIPANAISSGDMDASNSWVWAHDNGTPGTSIGYSSYPVSGVSTDNAARSMSVSYAHHGGEIYHVDFGNDTNASNFIYDTNIYITDPSQIANIEMDINQVISNGSTVILGTQCSIYSGTWEFVTAKGLTPHWNPSNLPCNPQAWSANTWHHVQIASHRTSGGNVSYDWVNLDGQVSYFSGAGGNAAMPLGWALGALVLNFQLDGASQYSGSMHVFTDQLNIYRW